MKTLNNLMKILCITLVLICSSYSNERPSEYLFDQQYNDECRVVSLTNLAKLNRLSEKYGSANILKAPWYEWFSRRESLGSLHNFYYLWLTSFNILQENKKAYPNLQGFIKEAVAKGPIMPNVRDVQDEVVKSVYFLERANMGYQVQNILIPFGKEVNGDYKIYNEITNTYVKVGVKDVKVPLKKCGYEYPIDLNKNIVLPPDNDLLLWQFSKFQNINRLGKLNMENRAKNKNEKPCITPDKPLGFLEVCILKRYPFEITVKNGDILPSVSEEYKEKEIKLSLSKEGKTKLMFLRLGLDENNDPMTNAHKLYGVYENLRDLCNRTQKHPWSDTYCKKEDFLQYQIAKILKEKKDLLKNVEWLMQAAKNEYWQDYRKFFEGTKYYRERNLEYDPKVCKDFLLGKEQMLAYILFDDIWTAMKDFISKGQIEAEKKLEIKYEVDETKEKISLLDVWGKIVEGLLKNTNKRNFFSFGFHGVLASFDKNIMDLQIAKNKEKYESFINKFGFILIESLADFKDTFYVRKREDNELMKTLRIERERILSVQEYIQQVDAVLDLKKNFKQKFEKLTFAQKLRETSDQEKQLSEEQLKTLTELENEVKEFKALADKKHKTSAIKIEKTFKKFQEKKKQKEQQKSVTVVNIEKNIIEAEKQKIYKPAPESAVPESPSPIIVNVNQIESPVEKSGEPPMKQIEQVKKEDVKKEQVPPTPTIQQIVNEPTKKEDVQRTVIQTVTEFVVGKIRSVLNWFISWF